MHIYGPRRTNGLLNENLSRRIWNMIITANYMSNSHFKIIHHNGKMV